MYASSYLIYLKKNMIGPAEWPLVLSGQKLTELGYLKNMTGFYGNLEPKRRYQSLPQNYNIGF